MPVKFAFSSSLLLTASTEVARGMLPGILMMLISNEKSLDWSESSMSRTSL